MNDAKAQGSIRRWGWVVPLLLGIAGVAGVVLRNRRQSRPDREWLATRTVERATVQYRDQVATGRSPTGNGVVRAQRPSAGDD
ncbi:MAG: hypothetical protein JWM45_700 [Pseudonocardiales bacterium]|nr:hypothetical protein [Pseudonocardiales bacterium]